MKALKFRTNVCSECCIRHLAHFFTDSNIRYWRVDLNHPLNVLTVEQANITAEEVKAIVRKAGFEIEQIEWFYKSELLGYLGTMN